MIWNNCVKWETSVETTLLSAYYLKGALDFILVYDPCPYDGSFRHYSFNISEGRWRVSDKMELSEIKKRIEVPIVDRGPKVVEIPLLLEDVLFIKGGKFAVLFSINPELPLSSCWDNLGTKFKISTDRELVRQVRNCDCEAAAKRYSEILGLKQDDFLVANIVNSLRVFWVPLGSYFKVNVGPDGKECVSLESDTPRPVVPIRVVL